MRASANTPAETTGACVARFPVAGGLPRYNGGSASASCFSRPARRLLAFSPAWSLNRLTRPFDARVLQSISLPPRTALAATNRSDSCCAGFAPARRKRLSTAHVTMHDNRISGLPRRPLQELGLAADPPPATAGPFTARRSTRASSTSPRSSSTCCAAMRQPELFQALGQELGAWLGRWDQRRIEIT